MGKFDSIPLLTESDDYYEWRRRIECLLLAEGVYNHVSNGTNPEEYITFASRMPQPRVPGAPNDVERNIIREWIKDDCLAKSIIFRKLGRPALTVIPDNVTISAREVWECLRKAFERRDSASDFALQYGYIVNTDSWF